MVGQPSHVKQLSLYHVCKIGLTFINKLFALWNHRSPPKIPKTSRVLYLGQVLYIFVNSFEIYLMRQSFLVRDAAGFTFFRCSNDFVTLKVYFSRLLEYNCSLIKVEWLAACIALRDAGAVLVVFLRRCVKFAKYSSQWEAKTHTWRNLPNPADQ